MTNAAANSRDQTELIIRGGGGEPLGYLVVDTFVGGRSHGGVRMHRGVTVEELRLLAGSMTLKYGFLGLPFGGAKAGVIGDPEADPQQKRARLAAFGRALAPLLQAELFVPAADMGTNLDDIQVMLDGAGVRYGRRRLPRVSSGEYTAHSVLACARALARKRGGSLTGMTAAVQGFGEVGGALAELLEGAGVTVAAVSTSKGALYDPSGLDVSALRRRAVKAGSAVVRLAEGGQRIRGERILTLEVDALFLCGQHHAVNESDVDELAASLICPAANAPWPREVEPRLEARGIAYLPDFAANSGGVLGTVMAYMGFTHRERVEFVQEVFERNTGWILERAAAGGSSVRTIGETLVDLRRADDAAGRRSRLDPVGWGLALHRRGLIPSQLVKAFAGPYLRRRTLAGLEG